MLIVSVVVGGENGYNYLKEPIQVRKRRGLYRSNWVIAVIRMVYVRR